MAKIDDLIKEKEELQIELDLGTTSQRSIEINLRITEIDKHIKKLFSNSLYREKNKEKFRIYREKNKEKFRIYREKNKERIKEKTREYNEKNKERIAIYLKKRYEEKKALKILQAQSKAMLDGIEIFLDSYNFAEENIIGEINIGNIVSNAIKSLELQDISLNEQEKTDLQEFTVEEIDRFFESL